MFYKIRYYLVLFVVPSLLWWLSGAFILVEPNTFLWTIEERASFSIPIFFSFVVAFFIFFEEEWIEKKSRQYDFEKQENIKLKIQRKIELEKLRAQIDKTGGLSIVE